MDNFFILILIFGILVLITHTLEGITGFGCTVIAMPFATMLFGIDVAKPVLTLYTLILTFYIVIISYKKVSKKHFIVMISAMLLGLPIGILLFNVLPKNILLKVLAIFMILVSIRGLLHSYNKIKSNKVIKNPILIFLVFLGGIIHGAFSSGGPLVIIYASEKIKDKSEFRATLCLIWTTLNTFLIAQMIFAGSFTNEVIKISIYGLPFLFLGTVLGDIAHKKIEDTIFTKLTYWVLLLTGIFMLF